MSLKGKVALVTGSSRGIGRAIALKLADEGADVIVNYFRKKEAAEAAARDISSRGVASCAIKANVGDPARVDAMFDEIGKRFGRLDILVSNAASGVARPAMDLDVRGWDWTMDINAKAFLLCAQRAVPLMKDGGKMVSISSLGSRLVMPVYSAVGVSKAALEALTRYLAVELAPKGICVNGVCAGAVETEALKIYTKGIPESEWKTNTPAGRMVSPEDIADLVAFLCSEVSFMVRGQIITIDGGLSLTQAMPGLGAVGSGGSLGQS